MSGYAKTFKVKDGYKDKKQSINVFHYKWWEATRKT